jgi:hypothetical protein
MDDLGEDESDEGESDNNDDDDDEEEEEEEEVSNESVHRFIRTFSNGDYDQEFDDALSSDRSAVVPNTRPTQASYNKPNNWVERNRTGLEKVIQHLQACIELAHHSQRFYLNLKHNASDQQLIDDEEPIVWHEPILDEYWNQPEEEIARKKQLDNITTDIERIQIENIEMKEERLAALVAIFRSGKATNSSTFVNFNNANLSAEGIAYLSEFVEVSSQVADILPSPQSD